MKKGTNDTFPLWLLWLLPSFFLLIYLLRLMAFVRFLLPLLLIFLLAGLLFFQLRKIIKNYRYKKSLEGQIEEKISFCRGELMSTEIALKDISENMAALEERLLLKTLDKAGKEKVKELLVSFGEEYALRLAKQDFFGACISRLEKVLAKHQLNRDLRQRKQHLEALRKDRGLSPEEMKLIEQDIKAEVDYVNSIGRLSRGMSKSKAMEEAELLKTKLEDIISK